MVAFMTWGAGAKGVLLQKTNVPGNR